MQRADIKPKVEYAFREKRITGLPFQKVRVIEHVRADRWKVEWLEPNPGLIHYASSGQLVVRWKDRRGFLKDEVNDQRLREYNEGHGYADPDSPVVRAVEQVYENVGEAIGFYSGILTSTSEVLVRFRTRIGLDPKEPVYPAYVDRHGQLHLPFDVAFELARKFCEVDPTAVLLDVDSTEQKWTAEACAWRIPRSSGNWGCIQASTVRPPAVGIEAHW